MIVYETAAIFFLTWDRGNYVLKEYLALAGVAQWLEGQPTHRRVAGSSRS